MSRPAPSCVQGIDADVTRAIDEHVLPALVRLIHARRDCQDTSVSVLVLSELLAEGRRALDQLDAAHWEDAHPLFVEGAARLGACALLLLVGRAFQLANQGGAPGAGGSP